jgi:dTDP-4-dehydrorhamnose 3,5-epimerase
MKLTKLGIPGVLLIESRVFEDSRGRFFEAWSERAVELGLPRAFVQDNVTFSRFGTLRGLHLQQPHAQGKLVMVLGGSVVDVVVDVRRGSPTFGRHLMVELSEQNCRQLFVPPGFAHGYLVQSDSACVFYKVTASYHPEAELGVRFDDPDLSIPWPAEPSVLSPKDAGLPRLSEIPEERLPRYEHSK